MIYLLTGTPGSGKSLHMACYIYHWLRSGHTCIANFDINVSAIKGCKGNFVYLDNEYLTPQNLVNISREYFKNHKFGEGKLRVFIDECQILHNARSWQESGRNSWVKFYSQHRKYGFDIFLVAQFDRMLDRQIRSLVEYEIIHRKITNFGLIGQITRLFTLGRPTFVAVKVWYPMQERVSSEFFTAHKKYYSLYDTYNTFEEFTTAPALSSLDGNSKMPTQTKNIEE